MATTAAWKEPRIFPAVRCSAVLCIKRQLSIAGFVFGDLARDTARN
jgi:hypothetical protein